MAKRKAPGTTGTTTADYRHSGETRKNIPPAKIAGEGAVPKVEPVRYAYNPHLPPILRFDPTGASDKPSALVDVTSTRTLNEEERARLRSALSVYEPWLEWAGKREEHEKRFFEVDPVALHIHERVSAQACIRSAMRKDVPKGLFADPEQSYREAVQFYQHDIDWANRLILGDSLQVMSSLAQRENLAGKVQMIYMDPPYGIKFASNFQPEVGSRTVRDSDDDLTREAETVRAFRDTWTLGTHSYISYLRTRLVLARELLTGTGSLFLQIGSQNVHYARILLDEVFGADNFQAQINFKSKSALGASGLPLVYDYILWYARDGAHRRFRELFKARDIAGDSEWRFLSRPDGDISKLADEDFARLTSFDGIFRRYKLTSSGFTKSCTYGFAFCGRERRPYGGKSWATNREGMQRLIASDRLFALGGYPNFKQFYSDFPVMKYDNNWPDQPAASARSFVVQTPTKFIERCMLMCTEPGDLVLDPTCGSGTSAFVAEQWGRRWISIDTSRVALAIARQRLLTARFEHYRTRGGPAAGQPYAENPATGLKYRTVSHITLKSIAQDPNLDAIVARHEPTLETHLEACNAAVGRLSAEARGRLATKLVRKERAEGKRAVTEAERRRWELPASRFEHWTVPFDSDPEWSAELRSAVEEYRKAWRSKMDEVNACIEANAEQEELVDQPEVVSGVVRVSGPFTVEGVRPEELSLGEEGLFDPTANEFDENAGRDPKITNLHAYLTKMLQSLRSDGVTYIGNKNVRFAKLESIFESANGSVLHAEGTWEGVEADGPPAVAVTFGPQYGPVTALQVEDAIRAAKRYDELVVAGFSFDAEASAVIEEQSHPKLRIHAAYIRPDINPGMDGLLKETPGSQLFTVFGQPDIVVKKTKDQEWLVRLDGVCIYNPVTNEVRSTGASKVAAWFLDSDYDGRCFCITQAFFPDQDAWEKIAKALGGGADPEAFDAFRGTESLAFAAGKHKRVAVKVIDPRGNEVMAIRSLAD